MSRLKNIFREGSGPLLNIYCTAGYPHFDSTIEVMQALQESGADIIELGMPYSDPLADGPVIQQSSAVAIANGMTITKLFGQLKDLRESPAQGGIGNAIPVILMGYMNPVLQYGFERFCADAAAAGIDGLILPDLPEYEFETMYGTVIKKYGLDFIFLVTPETAEERIKKLDRLSSGFLYAVSSSSTTGSNKKTDNNEYLQRLSGLQLKNPVLVGFGISDKAGFDAACQFADGAIIGSAYIRSIQNSSDIKFDTIRFIKSIRG
jgi:tryptophan synthase alpha chain